ncbi:ABC transporter ATP-binding protein [Rhodovibrionaceae bacterium A322]
MSVLLDVKGVSVAFGGVQALSDVSFSLNDGELLGLMGPNGAGKTTCMRSITGVVTPDQGSVSLKGQDISGLPVQDRVRLGLGLSQQIVRPFRSLSVLDNVTFAAGAAKTLNPWKALFHRDRQAEKDKALELLALVGIADAAEAEPSKLPLGYLKRLEMARALALSPQLLLLDEPLAGLNHKEAEKLADTILSLNKGGLSIILIEHNLGEVLRICSRLVVLDNGRNLAEGDPQQVMKDPLVRAAYLGEEVEGGQAA